MFTLSLLLAFFLMVCFKLTHNKTDGGGVLFYDLIHITSTKAKIQNSSIIPQNAPHTDPL